MKRIVGAFLAILICLGTLTPASAAESLKTSPLSGFSSNTYTRIDYSSQSIWKFSLVNEVFPEYSFTSYKGTDCIQIKYSSVGAIWKWFSLSTRDSVYYAMTAAHRGKDTVPSAHKYAVVTYATNINGKHNLCLHGFTGSSTVLESDISKSDGYWMATEPVEIPSTTLERINTPRYYILWSDIKDEDAELYVRDMILFESYDDAKAYSESVPQYLNGGYSPTVTEKKLVEKTVTEIVFDDMNSIDEAMITSKVESDVMIADDINEKNLRDPRDRVISGILSLESEGDNKYLRVSERIMNTGVTTIPIASEDTLREYGNGKYILTFDMKAITTDTMYVNRNLKNSDAIANGSKYFYYTSPFLSDKVAYRFGLLVGGISRGEGGYIEGTAPGEIRSLGDLGITDSELNSVSHPIKQLDTWKRFYYEFDVHTPGTVTLRINGGNWPVRNADYAIDNIRLTCLTEKSEQSVNSSVNKVPTDVKNEDYKIEGLVLNLDDSRFSEPNKDKAPFLTKEDALEYIDQYIDCHITDLMLCVNTTFMSMYPSEVWDDQLDEYAKTGSAQTAVWYRYEALGIDPWQLWIDRLKEKDVNPWLSFRMNDNHAHTKEGILTGDWFWENYVEYRRVKHRDDTIYRGDRCADFTVKAVRDYWLAYIEEAVNKYDVYGIELDWLRDPLFTSLGNEMAGMDTLTEFHRDIRTIVDRAELKWGHKIKIAIRCARDIETNVETGFDIVTMCANELVDVVIPSAYLVTDTEIPVQTWKKILKPYNVELYPNVTMGYIPLNHIDRSDSAFGYVWVDKYTEDNVEVIAGTAASYFAQGADKLYVFNVFGDSARPITKEQKVETDLIFPLSENTVRWRMQTTVGSYAKVQSMTRRYLLTYQDYSGFFGTSASQLPKTVSKVDRYAILHFYTGDINDTDNVTLYIGMENNAMDYSSAIKIYANGKEAVYKGTSAYRNNVMRGITLYSFKLDPTVLDNSVMLELTTTEASKPYTVVYAELEVS